MKKLLFVMMLNVVFITSTHGQTWEKIGPRITKNYRLADGPEIDYGSEKTPSPRTDQVTWASANGGLWLFGGIGFDENKQWGIFRDLWNYNSSTDTWTLVWGERNITSPVEKVTDDIPLPRKEAAAWIDNNGDLWMYGGRQFGDLLHLDDFWKFDLKTKSWAKISGKSKYNEIAERGDLKSENKNNTPGSRSLATSWTDDNGDLWLFGGVSYISDEKSVNGFYNDVWKFNLKKLAWQWVSGQDKPNQPTKKNKKDELGVTLPQPRAAAASWFDKSTNRIIIYGGMGYDSLALGAGNLSDMWAYSLEKDQWQFIGGSDEFNQNYRLANVVSEDKDNLPGFRINALSWTEKGFLYLSGGQNIFRSEQIEIDKNLWAYSLESGFWKMIPQTEISIVASGSAFTDGKGSLYVFGGKSFDEKSLKTYPVNSTFKLKL